MWLHTWCPRMLFPRKLSPPSHFAHVHAAAPLGPVLLRKPVARHATVPRLGMQTRIPSRAHTQHTHTLSLTLSLTHSLTHTLTHSHTLTHILTHTQHVAEEGTGPVN